MVVGEMAYFLKWGQCGGEGGGGGGAKPLTNKLRGNRWPLGGNKNANTQ